MLEELFLKGVDAGLDRAWYPLAAIAIAFLLRIVALLKIKGIKLDPGKLPKAIQWLPAALISMLGAFTDAAMSGKTILEAIGMALFAVLVGTPMAVGTHHIGKRVTPKLGSGGDSAKRTTLGTLAALAFVPLLNGCAGMLGWFGAATGALDVARALLAKVAKWFGEGGVYRETPGIPVSVWSTIDDLLKLSLDALDEADRAAKNAKSTEDEVKALYGSLFAIVQRLLKVLADLGWYAAPPNKGGLGKLVQPTGAVKLRADGTAPPLETLSVELPPENLS